MGYEPGADEPVVMGEEGRRKILERLEKGDITYQEAMSMLREGEV
jgi:hypothetical protein